MSYESWVRDRTKAAAAGMAVHRMPYRATKARNAAKKRAQHEANVQRRREENIAKAFGIGSHRSKKGDK